MAPLQGKRSNHSFKEADVDTINPITGVDQVQEERAADSCGPRALCGWSPPSRAADTALKRRVDRLARGNAAAIAVFLVVIGLLNIAPHLANERANLAVDGLAALVGGSWCTLNFWRCRHAHCLITGPGWLALSAFVFVEAGLGHSLIGGYEQPTLLGVLGLALLFEAFWYLTSRSNAVTPAR